jgi:5-bromo-4-chloroindolyl phosphate hydrolysis protein
MKKTKLWFTITMAVIAILFGILCFLPLYLQIGLGIGIGILGFLISVVNSFFKSNK